jgi:hypothetical protein
MSLLGSEHQPCSEKTESTEERFVKRLERTRIWEFRHAAQTGRAYQNVEDYDPVLKSHCDRTVPPVSPSAGKRQLNSGSPQGAVLPSASSPDSAREK